MRNYITTLKNKLFSYDNESMNDFDYATIGSLVVGLADSVWIVHDIIANGFGTAYGVIAMLLLMGNLMAVYGLHIHHKRAMFHRSRRRHEQMEKEYYIRKELSEEISELM